MIVVDDDPEICDAVREFITRFYVWGDVVAFTDSREAFDYCLAHETDVAIFVLDVFLEDETAFTFLDSISDKFPIAYEDSIIITGNASDDMVDICVASHITYLLEKPVRFYALQLAVRAIRKVYIKAGTLDPARIRGYYRTGLGRRRYPTSLPLLDLASATWTQIFNDLYWRRENSVNRLVWLHSRLKFGSAGCSIPMRKAKATSIRLDRGP